MCDAVNLPTSRYSSISTWRSVHKGQVTLDCKELLVERLEIVNDNVIIT
jgi:hypothetical protein